MFQTRTTFISATYRSIFINKELDWSWKKVNTIHSDEWKFKFMDNTARAVGIDRRSWVDRKS